VLKNRVSEAERPEKIAFEKKGNFRGVELLLATHRKACQSRWLGPDFGSKLAVQKFIFGAVGVKRNPRGMGKTIRQFQLKLEIISMT
jgi:hypothetical protein